MEETSTLVHVTIRPRNGNISPELRYPRRGFTSVERTLIWERDEGICGECNTLADKLNWHADHKIPYGKGGPTTIENGQVTHPTCNQTKSDNLTLMVGIPFDLKDLFKQMGTGALYGGALFGGFEALIQGRKLYKGETTWTPAGIEVAKELGVGAVTGTVVKGLCVVATVLGAPEIAVVVGSVAATAVISLGVRKVIRHCSKATS